VKPAFARVLPVAAVLALLQAGCYWPVPGQGPNRQSHNQAEHAIGVDTVASLHQAWAKSLDAGPAGDPVTSVFGVQVNSNRTVYAFLPDTGQERWSYTPAAPLSVSQPLVRGRDVLVGRYDNTAPAASANDGLDVTIVLDSGTGANRGPVADGRPVALRGSRGLFWDISWFGAPTQPAFWGAQLKVKDLGSGAVLCCDGFYGLFQETPPPPAPAPLTLGSKWIFNSGAGLNNSQTVEFGNGVRGYSIADSQLCSFAPIYVCPTWARALDGSTSTTPVLSSGEHVVFVGTDAGTVYAVDADSGAIQWSKAVGSAVTDSPALAGGSLFVPTGSGSLVVLDAATGALKWTGASPGSGLSQQPAVAGGVVFTGASNGTVAAYDAAGCGAASCSALWSRSTGSAISGAPAVSQGHLYVGTADGRLVAFEL
jgi:outer membrane protein assembly factor BamB